MKKVLIKIKNKIISKGFGAEKIQNKTIKLRCCGAWPDITKFINGGKIEKKGSQKGVKGYTELA